MHAPSEVWETLVTPSAELLLRTERYTDLPNGRSVYLGCDLDNRIHLLIPLDRLQTGIEKKTKAVVLVCQKMTLDGNQQYYADLVCMERHLLPIFEHLVKEICLRMANGENPRNSILSTLADWRALLDSESTTVKKNEVVGVRGELEILSRLVKVLGASILSTWRGPYGTRFDFLSEKNALEVKATTSQSSSTVHVHDVDQLTPPDNVSLVITHIRLHENSSCPSVTDLVQSLKAQGCCSESLNSCLEQLNYDEGDEEWNRGYEVVDLRGWHVTDAFPGIRSSRVQFPGLNGIAKIQYQLDLDAAGDPMKQSELDVIFREFV